MIKRCFIIFVLCFSSITAALAKVSVTDLRCEDLVDPLGIDVAKPNLSWRMEARGQGSGVRGQMQTAYQILCATDPKLLKAGKADLWDSGKVKSDASRYIKYAGKDILRGMPVYWTVKVWPFDKAQGTSPAEPSKWTYFDMTSNDKWQAKWITQNHGEGTAVPWLRRSFDLENAPGKACIYVNVLGYFQLYINGERVGDEEFAPHVGQYDKRTFCRTYEVSKYLKKGKNTVGFWLGSGWNRLGAGVQTTPSVRAQLEIEDAKGKPTVIVTDENWRTKASFMSFQGRWKWDDFGGEIHDGRLDEPEWANPDYDDSAWPKAALTTVTAPLSSAEMLQRSRIVETITPVSVKSLKPGIWLVDMGKAMTGTFDIKFPKGAAGHKVTMEFGDAHMGGERLNHFNQRSSYIFRGNGDEVFKGRFNYASCRYVLLKNVPEGEITADDIKGHFITTDLPIASTFECSNKTLNDIHKMMEHTLRCLMLGGYQVDCHSRERYGYGGDGYSSLDTTLSLLRADAFYRKWTRDWVDQQKPDGSLTYTSPASGHGGGPFWPGFLTAATLKHYYHYGDLSVVQRNYPAIKKWFELAQSKTVNGLQQKFCGGWYLGDWASPKSVFDKANAEVFIQPFMCYALEQAAELADVLGKTDDAKQFRGWIKERSAAVHKKFYDPQGKKYGSGDQVSYILPLAGGIVPDELRDEVFAGFEKTLLEKNKGHLSTGLSGTYMMIDYLQSIDRDDLIYTFASKTTFPSWGYMIKNGATATWELWHGRPGRGCTLIHNCYNSIGSWFIQGLGGIQPDPKAPGFKNAVIDPAFPKELTFVKASHDSVYGTIQSNWKREGDKIIMNIKIPANTTATVYVPGEKKPRQVESGEHTFEGKM
ncbi:hypothetical protein BVX94_01350 [bacterium B17]|nr:hypothetical protein BVX94_01350 [bacterium B17]